MKLHADDRRIYADYITSESVKSDSASQWEKFWQWLSRKYSSSCHFKLMQLCSDSSSLETESGFKECKLIGNDDTCYKNNHADSATCGFAATQIITTKASYRQELIIARKRSGNCRVCSQPAHSFLKKFHFGKAQWPSTLLSSCSKFQSMSVPDRLNLVEKLEGCYLCTSWLHQSDQCKVRSKSRCSFILTAGKICNGNHHKLLHQLEEC